MKNALASIVFVIAVFPSILYAEEVFYDITFSSPEHTVGQIPAVGSSITTPSAIVFGMPLVSESLGALQDQPLVFNTLGNSPSFYYEQIRLEMDSGTGFYYVSFDVVVPNFTDNTNKFTILFDTPNVQNITFRYNGRCDLFGRAVVPYENGELLHFEVLMNIAQKLTTVYINGTQRYNGVFSPGDYLRSIRFSFGLASSISIPDHSSYVGLDNIYVSSTVPQPCMPIADAGEDQFAFVNDENIAEVILDGSESYDPCGAELTYLWSWTVESEQYTADGVDPAIELPPGEYLITLVVNNGQCYSEADDVLIMVYDASFKRYNVYIGQGNTPYYYLDSLVDYYQSQPDINLTYEPEVIPADLTNYDLYITCAAGLSSYNYYEYTSSEISSLQEYLQSGRRVLFFSDHAGSGGSGVFVDPYLNSTLLPQLGSSMSFNSVLLDGGGHHDSIPGQILMNPFTEDINLIRFAAVNSIANGTPLLLASNLLDSFFSYERIGAGYLFLSGDKKLMDFANAAAWGYDNGTFFHNLVTVSENSQPIADAGPDQTVYAWFDGTAKVMLDGTDSYDDDGDPLAYLWSWTVDSKSFTASGPSPIIELPVGEHTIELTVNDGIDDSEPDWVSITVIPVIEVAMKFTPQTLNCHSQGNWVKAHFVLPEGFVIEDVDANTPAMIVPFGIESDHINVFINEDGLVEIEAAFNRADFCGLVITDDTIEVMVMGMLTTGQYFYGTDTIRIISKKLEQLAVLSSYWLQEGCGQPDWCSEADLNQDSVVNFVDFAMLDGCCIEVVNQ